MPADPKTVSKGVARGHVLCCCAVVFVCFMLTCLNLYMLSSTRAVLRHLDSRFDNHPRALQRQQLERQQVAQSPEEAAVAAAAMLLQQQQQQLEQQLQQQQGADDFVLLAPSDLDNAWTTQTGRLLVPVGQPEEDDDGWKQMQVQLAEQNKAQQEHIESLHDKLNDQYRAREELQRDQQDLLREHHKLSTEHQRQIAKKDRALLKERHRALRKGAKHQDELQQYKAEMANLKKVVEEVQSLDPAARPAAAEAAAPPTSTSNIAVDAVMAAEKNNNGGDPVVTVTALETAASSSSGRDDATTEPTNSLEHIFSAVFGGANPGAYFFPSYSVGADQAEQGRSGRGRRDLEEMRAKRKQRLAALAERLNGDRRRRRRHHEEAESTGPMMRIDDGELVPLAQAPVLKAEENQQGPRRRRLALHRGRHQA